MKDKLLITGGSGFLGSTIARIAADDFRVYATYNSHPYQISDCKLVPLDIRNKSRVFSVFNEINARLVIHTAALANVDYCEVHAEEAWQTNVVGTENVALAAREIGAKLLYISTDSVFDGKKGMYDEEDIPRPVNIYGKTKLEGESRVQHCLPDSSIIRTAFYGWGPSAAPSLANWVVNGLRKGENLKMFTDVFFSPIYVNNLVEVMVEMYRKGLSGTHHVGGKERCSKYAFGLEIARAFGLSEALISPASICEVPFKAPRPADLSLNIAKVSRLVNTKLLGVREGITWFKDSE